MTAPRFTAETLRKIQYPTDRETRAIYTYAAADGKPQHLAADIDELTDEERREIIIFIYANTIKKPRRRRERIRTAAEILRDFENMTIDLDEIAPAAFDIDAMIDPGELQKLLDDAEKRYSPAETESNGAERNHSI